MRFDNNWILWLIILFFGLPVLSVAASIFASTFALPLGISYGAAILIGITAYFLYIRGYPAQGWVLAGAVLVFCGLAYVLFRGFTTQAPTPPAGIEADLLDRYWEEERFFGGYSYFAFDNIAELDENPALITPYAYQAGFEGTNVLVLILPEIQSQRGQWAFTAATVRISGDQNFNPRIDGEMNTFVDPENPGFRIEEGGGTQSAQPSAVIPLRVNSLDKRTQKYYVDAELNLIYPDATGSLQQETLRREVEIIVPPATIYTYELQYSEYRSARALVEEFPTWVGLVLLMGLSAVVAVVMVRAGALESTGGRGFGGISMHVRPMSGLQKLGLEALALSEISEENRQGASTGLFIGVVNPQSPAGRADIRSGDVLLSFDGKALSTPATLKRLAAKFERGQYTEATLLRHGQEMRVTIKF